MNEVETNSLINFILKQGLALFVPKVINNIEMIAIKLNSLSDLEPDNIGILTPKSGEILLEPIDIAITPGIGFTKIGGRIGYGHGYYDRWFSKNLVKTKVGIAFEEQIVEKLPLEETDIPIKNWHMHMIFIINIFITFTGSCCSRINNNGRNIIFLFMIGNSPEDNRM